MLISLAAEQVFDRTEHRFTHGDLICGWRLRHRRKGGHPCGVKTTKKEWIVSLFHQHRLKSAQARLLLTREGQNFVI